MAIRDTTVLVTKATEVGDMVYRGGYHVVTKAEADKIVAGGFAQILGDDKSTSKKASGASKPEGA